MKKGIILANTGTPSGADEFFVKRYLRQFLNDPRVVDLPRVLRWLLVNMWIVPMRAKKSSEAYRKIWTSDGPPLLTNSLLLKEQLSARLGDDYCVEIGMRYGEPTMVSAIDALQKQDCSELILLPLFPQYASASTGSVIEAFLKHVQSYQYIPAIKVLPAFYDQSGFIGAYAALIQTKIQEKQPDLVLFSYHGLPLRHIQKNKYRISTSSLREIFSFPLLRQAFSLSSLRGAQRRSNPDRDLDEQPIWIASLSARNDGLGSNPCYKTQCLETSRLLAEKLGLAAEQYTTGFQSRLGRLPWIQPYTDELLPSFIDKGIKHLLIACPSFTVDCLETLEEIAIRLRETWHALGGESFDVVPCLNASPLWIDYLARSILS